jgi:hypothetical protein
VIFVAVLIGSGLLVYLALEGGGRNGTTEPTATTEGQATTPTGSPEAAARVQNKG